MCPAPLFSPFALILRSYLIPRIRTLLSSDTCLVCFWWRNWLVRGRARVRPRFRRGYWVVVKLCRRDRPLGPNVLTVVLLILVSNLLVAFVGRCLNVVTRVPRLRITFRPSILLQRKTRFPAPSNPPVRGGNCLSRRVNKCRR